MFSYTSLYLDNPPIPGRAMDLWIPEEPRKPFTLFFIHGGGWRQGHREDMHRIMHGFHKEGYPCVSICYRVKKTTVAEQLGDIREGMAVAEKLLAAQGIRTPFVLYGSSAGGHLALLAGLAPAGACGDAIRAAVPVAGIIASCAPVTFEPWEDIFPGSRDSMQDVAGRSYKEDPLLYKTLSPSEYAGPSSPPVFFLMGENEHMFPNALTLSLAGKLGSRARCEIYPAAEHGFFYELTRRCQQLAFRDVLSFLDDLSH